MSSSRASHLEDIGSRHEVNRLLAPYKRLHPEFVVRFSWWMCSLAWLHRNKGFKIRTGALPGFPLCFQNYVHTPQQSLLASLQAPCWCFAGVGADMRGFVCKGKGPKAQNYSSQRNFRAWL